jgi:hypothetical protein
LSAGRIWRGFRIGRRREACQRLRVNVGNMAGTWRSRCAVDRREPTLTRLSTARWNSGRFLSRAVTRDRESSSQPTVASHPPFAAGSAGWVRIRSGRDHSLGHLQREQ